MDKYYMIKVFPNKEKALYHADIEGGCFNNF